MIEIRNLTKTFRTTDGRAHTAIQDVSTSVPESSFVSLLGPSGCGKSTLLYMVGGFIAPTSGAIEVGGRAVAGPGPAPSAVLLRRAEELPTPEFLGHVLQTLLRLFAGFGLAAFLGVALGLTAASSRLGGRLLEPSVRVLAPIPEIALYPALMLVLAFDHASKIALVTADAVFPILLATYQGARRVEPKLVWSALAAGTSPRAATCRVVLPAALPSILTGCRFGAVIACVVVFLAEMSSSTDGLGHLLVRAARSFRTVDLFVPLVAISLLGLAFNAGLLAVRARLLAGYPEEE